MRKHYIDDPQVIIRTPRPFLPYLINYLHFMADNFLPDNQSINYTVYYKAFLTYLFLIAMLVFTIDANNKFNTNYLDRFNNFCYIDVLIRLIDLFDVIYDVIGTYKPEDDGASLMATLEWAINLYCLMVNQIGDSGRVPLIIDYPQPYGYSTFSSLTLEITNCIDDTICNSYEEFKISHNLFVFHWYSFCKQLYGVNYQELFILQGCGNVLVEQMAIKVPV